MGRYINIGNAGFQRARSDSRSLFADLNIAHDPSFEQHLNKAHGIDVVHDEHTSILSYNNENSLSCVISLAYYYAHGDYLFYRELATGKAAVKREQCQACLDSAEREQVRTKSKGFADIVLIPRKNVESPAIILELKYNQDADTAIDQILRKQYPAKVTEYCGELLLVGINYDKKDKTHQCKITKVTKEDNDKKSD